MSSTLDVALAPSGWYNDPAGSGMLRWWDGSVWTEQFQPAYRANSYAGYAIHRLPKPGA